jgi:hypothetical protein
VAAAEDRAAYERARAEQAAHGEYLEAQRAAAERTAQLEAQLEATRRLKEEEKAMALTIAERAWVRAKVNRTQIRVRVSFVKSRGPSAPHVRSLKSRDCTGERWLSFARNAHSLVTCTWWVGRGRVSRSSSRLGRYEACAHLL